MEDLETSTAAEAKAYRTAPTTPVKAHPRKTVRYEVSSGSVSQRWSRRGSAAAKAPREPAVSRTTLYQARLQVRDASGARPGMIACSRENAAERSVPVPFNIPTKAISRRIGKPGVKARARKPITPRSDSTTSVLLRPARSAFVVTPTVAKADPAKPAAITIPMLNEERPTRNR